MLEESVFTLEVPYRETMEVRAFSFGVDEAGHALGTNGAAAGLRPSLCLVAGLRGDEIQQTLVGALLVDRLERMEREGMLTAGRLIRVIPCVNSVSMGIGRRFWPGDGTDINRMFPGSAYGNTTERIAAAVFAAARGFDWGVHLSSFYLEGDFLPHVRIMHGPGEKANHGADFGLPYVTHYEPGVIDTATLHYNWRRYGTEAYTFYTKETTVADERAADEAVRSILRFMAARGLVRPLVHGGARSFDLAERDLVSVAIPTGGLLCPRVQVGDLVERGQPIALVRDLLRGSVLAELVAPCDGVVFYRACRPLVNEQTLAFQVVPSDVGCNAEGFAGWASRERVALAGLRGAVPHGGKR